jgi:hypothetical protein
VALPVAAFRGRIDKLARECAMRTIRNLPAGATPHDTVAAVARFLQAEQGFGVPESGRSSLPENAILDHRAHRLFTSPFDRVALHRQTTI